MTVDQAFSLLDAEVVCGDADLTRAVRHVVASDLMSDVLLVDEEDILLLTSLASEQVLRTAHIVGASGVVVVNGKSIPESMAEVARELRMPLATAKLSKFSSCVAIHQGMGVSP